MGHATEIIKKMSQRDILDLLESSGPQKIIRSFGLKTHREAAQVRELLEKARKPRMVGPYDLDDLGIGYLVPETLPGPFLAAVAEIQELRELANQEEREIHYDPVDYGRKRVEAFRLAADQFELELEARLGYKRPDSKQE